MVMMSLLLSLLLVAHTGPSIQFSIAFIPDKNANKMPFILHLASRADQVYCHLESDGYPDFKFLFRGADTTITLLPAAPEDSIAYQYPQEQVNFLISAGLGQTGLKPLVQALQSFSTTRPILVEGAIQTIDEMVCQKAVMQNNSGKITCWVSQTSANGMMNIKKQLSGITIIQPLLQILEQMVAIGFPVQLSYQLSNGEKGALRIQNIRHTVPQSLFDLSTYQIVRN